MPWYRFTSKHGPGHMGHSEGFQFFNHKLDKEELRYEWEHTFRDYDDNIGDAKIVRKLPAVITLTKKLHATQKMTQEALRLQRQQMLEDFEAQKRAAAAAGDTETYDKIRQKEDKVYRQIAEQERQPEPEPAPQATQGGQEAILQKWLSQNRWMNNHLLAGKAQAIAQRYADKGITGVEQLQNVRDEIFKLHPDMVAEYGYDTSEYVEKPKPAPKPAVTESDPESSDPEGGDHEEDEHDAAPSTPKPQAKKRTFSPVEGGTPSRGTPARASNKRDWKSIPEGERKELFAQFVKPGYFKDDAKSLERLAKSWWDSNSPEE